MLNNKRNLLIVLLVRMFVVCDFGVLAVAPAVKKSVTQPPVGTKPAVVGQSQATAKTPATATKPGLQIR